MEKSKLYRCLVWRLLDTVLRPARTLSQPRDRSRRLVQQARRRSVQLLHCATGRKTNRKTILFIFADILLNRPEIIIRVTRFMRQPDDLQVR